MLCLCVHILCVCVCVCACVQIFLYFDELELCNPLGSKRSIHKIGAYKPCIPDNFVLDISFLCAGAFYFTLRSKLKSIQLLALVKNSLIKKYGMNSVLEPIVKDLKALVSFKQ